MSATFPPEKESCSQSGQPYIQCWSGDGCVGPSWEVDVLRSTGRHWQINPQRRPLHWESLNRTTKAQRQSHLTPISTSPPPPASRQACSNHCPLPVEIYANHREQETGSSAKLGFFSAEILPQSEAAVMGPKANVKSVWHTFKCLTGDGQNGGGLVKVILLCGVS